MIAAIFPILTAAQIIAKLAGKALAVLSLSTNTVNEGSSGSGVTVDGVLLKDAGITATGITASRALVTGSGSEIQASSVTTTTLGYLDATSSIQTQLDAKAPSASPTLTGTVTASLINGASGGDLVLSVTEAGTQVQITSVGYNAAIEISAGQAGILMTTESNSNVSINPHGTGKITTTKQIASTLATGTAPFSVSSTTVVSNLNASLLQGNAASAFATAAQGSTADSALQDVVDDTTPTLGGDLDGDGNKVSNVGIATATYAANQTLTAAECFGGTVRVTAAATMTLPAIQDGMSVAVATEGDVAVSVKANASDKIYLDGVALDDGDKITNTSSSGDMAVLWYHSAAGWYASTNSWTDGGA